MSRNYLFTGVNQKADLRPFVEKADTALPSYAVGGGFSKDDFARIQREAMAERRAETAKKFQISNEKLAAKKLELDRIDALIKWWKENGNFVLQKPTGPSLHHFIDALGDKDKRAAEALSNQFQTLIIEHDWAKAFASANLEQGPFKLPYDHCCFEFLVSGVRVIALLGQRGDQVLMPLVAFYLNKEWLASPFNMEVAADGLKSKLVATSYGTSLDEAFDTVSKYLFNQVRAVCVMLDAEVAETEVIRAPHKLNAIREKKGKSAQADYHVVSLAKRSRAAPMDGEAESGRKMRLHFRRGHWRHFPQHKTWIKWMLVGDPDLGFVDKEYRL